MTTTHELPAGLRIARDDEPGWTYRTTDGTLWVTDEPAKEIAYDRETRHYRMVLNGEFVGYARTAHEAETTLNQLAMDLITSGITRTATELDGGDPEAVTLVEPDAYQAMVAADDAWQAELERLFGRNAGDVRYTEEGRTGPALAPLYAEYRRTCAAWHDRQIAPTPPIDTCTICGGPHRPTQCPRMAHAPIYVCPSCDDLTLSCGLCPACTETGETLPATQPTNATIAAAA